MSMMPSGSGSAANASSISPSGFTPVSMSKIDQLKARRNNLISALLTQIYAPVAPVLWQLLTDDPALLLNSALFALLPNGAPSAFDMASFEGWRDAHLINPQTGMWYGPQYWQYNGNLLTEFLSVQQQIDELESQKQAVIDANEYLEPLDPLEPEHLLEELIALCAEEPGMILETLQDGMKVFSEETDSRIQDFLTQRKEITQARQEEFQAFMNARVEVEMEYFQDEMSQAQDRYNALGAQVSALMVPLQKLQDDLSMLVTSLGVVIGFYSQQNGISTDNLGDLAVLTQVLTGIVGTLSNEDAYNLINQANQDPNWHQQAMATKNPYLTIYANEGRADIEVVKQTVGGAIRSDSSHALDLLNQIHTGIESFKVQKDSIQAEQKKVYGGMLAIKDAWEKAKEKINSPEYTQQATADFNASPENALIQADLDEVTGPMNSISGTVKALHETMEDLFNDIEIEAINHGGMNLPDVLSLPYEEKKKIWFGVIAHLEEKLKRFHELQNYIFEITNRIHNNTKQPGDEDNLVVAKIALLNIMAAQLIYRKLSGDYEFQLRLKEDMEKEAKDYVSHAKTSADETSKGVTPAQPSTQTQTQVKSEEAKPAHNFLLYAGAGVALLAVLNGKKEKRNG